MMEFYSLDDELLETSPRSTSIDVLQEALSRYPRRQNVGPRDEQALSQTGTSEVPVFSCFEAGCSALFERLPDQKWGVRIALRPHP
jgi:hypothetical protein